MGKIRLDLGDLGGWIIVLLSKPYAKVLFTDKVPAFKSISCQVKANASDFLRPVAESSLK